MIFTIISWLIFWAPFILGVFFAVQGFRKTKGVGYLFLAVFFLNPLFGIFGDKVSQIINEEEYRHELEVKKRELERKLEEGELIMVDNTLHFPMFESLAMVGVFLLQRRRIEPVAGGDATRWRS